MSIEKLCQTYPDVPRSVIVKNDVMRQGVRLSQAAKAALSGMDITFKGFFIFSQDIGHSVVPQEKIPFWFRLSDDTRIIVRSASQTSPYVIDWTDGKFVLCDETGVVDGVGFDPAPQWSKRTFEDGTPFVAVVSPTGPDSVTGTMSHICDRWKRGERCLYCDIGGFLRAKKLADRQSLTTPTPEMIATVFEAAQKEPGCRHFCLTSGSIIGTRDGKTEIEFYLDYLNTINERINGNWMSSFVAIQPQTKENVRILKEAGAPALMMNLEVWGERLFNIFCPGKAKLIGWEGAVRRAIEAVEIFGKGRILSNFVGGVELARPWGYTDVSSAVKATLEGFDFLMAHGVLPRTSAWAVEPGSELAGQELPPLEYFIELGRGYLELRQKHNFTFPFYGFCRGCYIQDAIPEWDYYLWDKRS